MTGPSTDRRARGARRGFTLLELMIVIAIIAIVATIAIPNLMAARLAANESAVISVLRNVATAEAQFQRAGRADEDNDMCGEFGSFAELTGVVPARGSTIVSLQLTRSMAVLDGNGEVNRNGYFYRMYMADPTRAGVREGGSGAGYAAGVLDPDHAESIWVCYAYPAKYGSSGNQTFFMSSHGSMLRAEVPAYEIANCAALLGGAAFLAPATGPDDVTGRPAVGQPGLDGNTWKQVQ